MNTAVILSARKEHDSEIPYPVKQFANNTCLIDRTLSILRECGYKKIIVVVGYHDELYKKYSSDDVARVYNPEYEFTASMGSLALC